MDPIELAAIEAFLRRAPYLHLYELGDLDPRERAHTTWIANHPVDGVVLLYTGLSTPTIVALVDGADGDDRDLTVLRNLLARTAPALPARCYAHLTAGLETALAPRFGAALLGRCLKMALTAPAALPVDAVHGVDDAVVRLSPVDADAAARFYAESYPDGYFEPVNLERGPHLAICDDRGIAAVAGVHVYSESLRVASLGNIATRPDARGRGLARRVTAAMCRYLASRVDVIGLNVRADNAAAIACYRAVGFEIRHAYAEWVLTAS